MVCWEKGLIILCSSLTHLVTIMVCLMWIITTYIIYDWYIISHREEKKEVVVISSTLFEKETDDKEEYICGCLR